MTVDEFRAEIWRRHDNALEEANYRSGPKAHRARRAVRAETLREVLALFATVAPEPLERPETAVEP